MKGATKMQCTPVRLALEGLKKCVGWVSECRRGVVDLLLRELLLLLGWPDVLLARGSRRIVGERVAYSAAEAVKEIGEHELALERVLAPLEASESDVGLKVE